VAIRFEAIPVPPHKFLLILRRFQFFVAVKPVGLIVVNEPCGVIEREVIGTDKVAVEVLLAAGVSKPAEPHEPRHAPCDQRDPQPPAYPPRRHEVCHRASRTDRTSASGTLSKSFTSPMRVGRMNRICPPTAFLSRRITAMRSSVVKL